MAGGLSSSVRTYLVVSASRAATRFFSCTSHFSGSEAIIVVASDVVIVIFGAGTVVGWALVVR